MQVGESAESIQVVGESPALQTDSSTVQDVLAEKTVQDLPLNNRNLTGLIQLSAGVTPGDPNALSSGNRVSGRTVNMECGVLRRMLKKAKLFVVLADFPKPFPEHEHEIAKVLTAEAKRHLFAVAASKPAWMVAHCAAVLAASTTCRKIELRHLRWRGVDFFGRAIAIHRC
jgi:hypothetical protein